MRTFVLAFFTLLLFNTTEIDGQVASTCDHYSDLDMVTYDKILAMPDPGTELLIEMPVVIHQLSNYNEGQVMGMMTNLNNYFSDNDLAIDFTLCNYIDYDTAVDLSNGGINEIVDLYHIDKVINIYVFADAGGSGAGTTTSDVGPSYIRVSRFEPSLIVHEMGHYFGLLHTHNSFWGDELVDGSNCATAGDRFCDTPADPNLSGELNGSCEYVGNETDANGDQYMPDTSNLMSYAWHFCRNSFSEEQKAFMLNFIDQKYSDYSCMATSVESDEKDVEVKVYPNPTNGVVFFELPDRKEGGSYFVDVLEFSGKRVLSGVLSNNKLDLTSLSSGVYLMKIYIDNNVTFRKIFLK